GVIHLHVAVIHARHGVVHLHVAVIHARHGVIHLHVAVIHTRHVHVVVIHAAMQLCRIDMAGFDIGHNPVVFGRWQYADEIHHAGQPGRPARLEVIVLRFGDGGIHRHHHHVVLRKAWYLFFRVVVCRLSYNIGDWLFAIGSIAHATPHKRSQVLVSATALT